ncbi:MAG TPA: phosphate ABC transporter, permease protein PstA, partial [Azonexus sp.]
MQALTTEQIRALIARGKMKDTVFQALGIICLAIGLLVIFLLVGDMLQRGMERLNLDFFTNFASRKAAQSGILSAWVGTILVMFVTALAAVPLGVAAGIYLEEYAKRNWVTDIIEINITNLAAVPSIVYGLLSLGIFVYAFGLGQSILAAGLTLAL